MHSNFFPHAFYNPLIPKKEVEHCVALDDFEISFIFVTFFHSQEMMENVKSKTIAWNFIQCLEPPRIVQIRAQDMMSKSNVFAQVTVRLHTQQTLAVYDRFGRLMHGSESTVKDVLEYVVFEKHLTNPYAQWKIHGKIIPSWLPPRDSITKTYPRPDIEKEFPEPEEEPPKEEAKQLPSGEAAVATA